MHEQLQPASCQLTCQGNNTYWFITAQLNHTNSVTAAAAPLGISTLHAQHMVRLILASRHPEAEQVNLNTTYNKPNSFN